eukprot:15045127-Heterocapsa_arctica.AAC.1
MPAGYTVCISCQSPFIFADINVEADAPMRCDGPARFAAPAIISKDVSETDAAPALMGQAAASSSYDATTPARVYTPEQVAAAGIRNKSPYTHTADINATLRRVILYRWSWDNNAPHLKHLAYARDGCTRWYPGKGFVRQWNFTTETDPGME